MLRCFLIVLMAVLLSACGKSAEDRAAGPVRVVVSIAPLKGLVDELAKSLGDGVQVDLLVPVGHLEHGYEIAPEMISKLVKADLVVYVGMGLEPQVEKLLKDKPVKSRRAVCFADVVGIEGDGHDHHHDHDHAHGETCDHGVDPHLWLDPSLVAKLVPALAKELGEAARARGMSEKAAAVEAAASGLAARVSEVDAAYEEKLRPHRGATFITAHAAWGRLADRYGLEQAPLGGLEASEPSPDAIASATELIREKKTGVIFSEPQINAQVVERLAAATNARVRRLDPLGSGDWFAMMESNLGELLAGLAGN